MSDSFNLKHWLDHFCHKIRESKKCLAVFDIDSTLYDVSPRTEKILQEFAHHPMHNSNFPKASEILKKTQILPSDWGYREAFERHDLLEEPHEFHHSLKEFWTDKFFSNHYLHLDNPYEGAVQFVNKLYDTGASIAYLTGRDFPRMGEGTHRILKESGFPVNPPRAEVALKPSKGLDDARFKCDWFISVLDKYDEICFFENEPVNINWIQEYCPKVEIIYFDSTHSGLANPPFHLPTITDYKI
jgi:hypothetical protein